MLKIAVTGGIASGKTTVCNILKKEGAFVVNLDHLVHNLLTPETAEGKDLVKLMGEEIIKNHELDRKKIAKKVFNDPKILFKVEKIIHPILLKEIEKLYQKKKEEDAYRYFVVEVPLLFEVSWEKAFDIVIAVIAEPSIAKKRYGSNEEYEKRMKRQFPLHLKAQKADFIIYNNGSFEDLQLNVKKLLKKI